MEILRSSDPKTRHIPLYQKLRPFPKGLRKKHFSSNEVGNQQKLLNFSSFATDPTFFRQKPWKDSSEKVANLRRVPPKTAEKVTKNTQPPGPRETWSPPPGFANYERKIALIIENPVNFCWFLFRVFLHHVSVVFGSKKNPRERLGLPKFRQKNTEHFAGAK